MIAGEHVLLYMAEGTGGRVFMPTVGPELDKAFADIVSELRTQYMLGFYPRNVPLTKDRFHKLQVKVNRPQLQVSSRNGYYGDSEGVTGAADARISVAPDNVRTLSAKTKKR
jgi:Ca-activated chloride channel family protein